MNPVRPARGRLDAATGRWLAERYEELRSESVAERAGRQGRWVLITRGMAEWARVCASYADTAPVAAERGNAIAGQGSRGGLAAGEVAEIVRVLAGMVGQVEQEGQR